MRGTNGQFFLLAAVIISAVIISFGAGTNKASVNEELDNFYVSSDEMKREIAAFLDYAVYENVDDEVFTDFLESLAENIKETNPSVDVAFIYWEGKGNQVIVENYGSRDVYVNEDRIEARGKETSSATDNGIRYTTVTDSDVDPYTVRLGGENSFLVRINEESDGVSFKVSDHRKVILVTQREERGDIYVSIG